VTAREIDRVWFDWGRAVVDVTVAVYLRWGQDRNRIRERVVRREGRLASALVSYAPSVTMFARLTETGPSDLDPPRLLVMGDPTYRAPEAEAASLPTLDDGLSMDGAR
jgi:hypothetical protein